MTSVDGHTRILFADPDPTCRELLRMLLESEPSVALVGEADDGRKLVELADAERPDIVLTEIALPGLSGLEATRRLQARCPDTAVVMLTSYDERPYLVQALRAGAAGYVLKQSMVTDLLPALQAAASGQVYVSRPVAGQMN